jgi:hypothetical protein
VRNEFESQHHYEAEDKLPIGSGHVTTAGKKQDNDGGGTPHVLLLTHLLRKFFVVISGINRNVIGRLSEEVRLVCFE